MQKIGSIRRREGIYWTTKVMARICLAPVFRLHVEGVEGLPRDKAFVLLPKHQRWEDIPLLTLASPRPLYYVAKHELFQNSAAGWFLRSIGGIPLNRQRPVESRWSLKQTLDLLRGGEGVVIFPEGTYYRESMGQARVGVVRLVLSQLTLPFVPVGIRYHREGVRTQVWVRMGTPSMGGPDLPAGAFLNAMMTEIARLSGLS